MLILSKVDFDKKTFLNYTIWNHLISKNQLHSGPVSQYHDQSSFRSFSIFCFCRVCFCEVHRFNVTLWQALFYFPTIKMFKTCLQFNLKVITITRRYCVSVLGSIGYKNHLIFIKKLFATAINSMTYKTTLLEGGPSCNFFFGKLNCILYFFSIICFESY